MRIRILFAAVLLVLTLGGPWPPNVSLVYAQKPEHEGPHDDHRRIEVGSPLHDQVAEPGVGADELRPHDDEKREPEAEAQRHDDAGQRRRKHDAAHEIGAGRAEARRRPQQHDVDAEDARGDAHEHRKERGIRDERDLRRLPQAEPHEEHRQES